MLNIQPDHFVAVDGSIQSLTGDDYAEAADTMLSTTETIPDANAEDRPETAASEDT